MYDVAMPDLDPVNCATCVPWENNFAQTYFANQSLVKSFSNYCAHLGNAPGMYQGVLDASNAAGAESAFCMCDTENWTPCESNVMKRMPPSSKTL